MLCLRNCHCLRHHCQCSIDRRVALCHVAGTSCTDYSAIGNGDKEHGATFVPFLAWVSHRKILREPVIVQENVVPFPRELLIALLPEYEFAFGVVTPQEFGWPIRRDRQWCVSEAQCTTFYGSSKRL